MKILLLGEYSGLHKNLKEGLELLGHEVIVAARQDGWKKIQNDINLDSSFKGFIGKIHRHLKFWFYLRTFKNFDVVQLVNPFDFYPRHLSIAKWIYKWIKKNNKRFFLLAAGDDSYFWREAREVMEYGPFEDFLKYDAKVGKFYMEHDEAFAFNKWLSQIVDGVIPIMYEYEIGYKNHSNRLATIPIPMNTRKIKCEENKFEKKIVIFHGLNRYGFKGTKYVEEAFDYLSKKYPNNLELIIDGKMPLDQYLKLMRKTNIVIDQVNSYSLGVNGLYAMAMGKVVLGGAEKNGLEALGVNSSPVINIKPSAKSIVDEVEKLIECKEKIPEIGKLSRLYVEKYHDHEDIARKYVKNWLSIDE